MNIYCLSGYEDYRLFTHELKMDREQVRELLLQHVTPLAELEARLFAEGEERFGKSFLYYSVVDGKVRRRWRTDSSIETDDVLDVDATAFESFEDRYFAAIRDTVGIIARAAGFEELTPESIFCPDYTPLEVKKALENNR